MREGENDLFEKLYTGYDTVIGDAAVPRWSVRIYTRPSHGGGTQQVVRTWMDFRFVTLVKYQWFFRVRAAQIQLANPRLTVFIGIERQTIDADSFAQMQNIIENRITARRGKITQYNNALKKLKATWSELLPIEDHPNYKNHLDQLEHHERELVRLTEMLEQQKTNPQRNPFIQ